MDIDSTIGYKQPRTIHLGDSAESDLDEISTIWHSAEALSSPNLEARWVGFKSLLSIRAHLRSPLIAYLFATRLADPNLELRAEVAKAVLQILNTQEPGDHILEAGRIRLAEHVSQMRIREIYALLQIADGDLSSDHDIAKILNYNPYAGGHLAEIVSDWQRPLSIRKKAAALIGMVGYLEAIPVLERIGNRLESRYSGKQISMWQIEENSEASLLPVIERTLSVLQAP